MKSGLDKTAVCFNRGVFCVYPGIRALLIDTDHPSSLSSFSVLSHEALGGTHFLERPGVSHTENILTHFQIGFAATKGRRDRAVAFYLLLETVGVSQA